MFTERKNGKVIMDAIRAQNSGQHTIAANLFQRAGNQYRNPSEKADLWAAAERARRIASSD